MTAHMISVPQQTGTDQPASAPVTPTAAAPSPRTEELPATLEGASVWDEQVYQHVLKHARDESEMVAAYAAVLADARVTPDVRWLLDTLGRDEVHHHRLMTDLAAAIRDSAELRRPTTVPSVAWKTDPVAGRELLEVVELLLKAEQDDRRELRRLGRELRPLRDTTLWSAVIDLMAADTAKHATLLKTVRRLLRAQLEHAD